MRRRRNRGPRLDFVDVLVIRHTARYVDEPQMDPEVRAARGRELADLAEQHGFVTVTAMRAEADRLHAEWEADRAGTADL